MRITDVELLPHDAALREMAFVTLGMDAAIHGRGEAGGMRLSPLQ